MSESPPLDGRSTIERSGFSYLPRFITADEAAVLIRYLGAIAPLWEERHRDARRARSTCVASRLTRPVYWLGAWQFACLGYYAEPDHREGRCLSAEPFPPVMSGILERLRRRLERLDPAFDPIPKSCLINYYGREVGEGPPRDYARLRMHRDGEPGPVTMFSIGQPGLLEFLDPDRDGPEAPELSVWTRHRSVTILSGPEFKDRLYHRITRVRNGKAPALTSRVEGFETRRVSISFRHVPDELVRDFDGLPEASRELVRDYVETLADDSEHFRDQLSRSPRP